MALFPSGLLLLIYLFQLTSTSCSASTSFSLSAELSNFVPDCAKDCFESFLDANFPISICTISPSLQCLCSHNSTSGYTIAEGAVQCIVSEDDIRSCTGANATQAVVEDAYAMCVGQVGALSNTHATLTATLLESPSSSGVLLFPPASTTTSSNLSKTTSAGITASSTSSTSRSISSIQTTSASSSQSTFLTTSSSSASSANITSSTSTPLASDTSSPTTVSSLSRSQVIGIAIGSTGGAALALGGLFLVACIRRKRARANRDSDMLPFQTEPNYPSSLDLGFRGPIENKTIIYGPGGTANGLATKIPPQVPPRGPSTSPNMFSRRSIHADTIGLAVSAESARSISPQWRKRSSKLLPEKPDMGMRSPQAFGFPKPPATLPVRQSSETTFEEDLETPSTQRRSTMFAAPQVSNRDTPDSLQVPESLYVKPLNINRRPSNNYSQPFRPPTHASSIYSAQPSTAHSTTSSIMNRPRKSYRQYHPYRQERTSERRSSSASLTSFESLDSVFDAEPKTGISGVSGDLSPVVESPRPLPNRTGPGMTTTTVGRLPQDTIRLVPPPPQPDFKAAMRREQDLNRNQYQNQYQNQYKPLYRNPSRDRDQNPKPWEKFEANAARSRRLSLSREQERNLPPTPTPDAPTSAAPPASAAAIHSYLWADRRQNQTSTENSVPASAYVAVPNPPFANPQASPSDTPTSATHSVSSAASSLLAKRRGSRAPVLTVGRGDASRNGRGRGKGWRVVNEDSNRGQLPGTPGWKPRLTPTRRGEDLFISVQ